MKAKESKDITKLLQRQLEDLTSKSFKNQLNEQIQCKNINNEKKSNLGSLRSYGSSNMFVSETVDNKDVCSNREVKSWNQDEETCVKQLEVTSSSKSVAHRKIEDMKREAEKVQYIESDNEYKYISDVLEQERDTKTPPVCEAEEVGEVFIEMQNDLDQEYAFKDWISCSSLLSNYDFITQHSKKFASVPCEKPRPEIQFFMTNLNPLDISSYLSSGAAMMNEMELSLSCSMNSFFQPLENKIDNVCKREPDLIYSIPFNFMSKSSLGKCESKTIFSLSSPYYMEEEGNPKDCFSLGKIMTKDHETNMQLPHSEGRNSMGALVHKGTYSPVWRKSSSPKELKGEEMQELGNIAVFKQDGDEELKIKFDNKRKHNFCGKLKRKPERIKNRVVPTLLSRRRKLNCRLPKFHKKLHAISRSAKKYLSQEEQNESLRQSGKQRSNAPYKSYQKTRKKKYSNKRRNFSRFRNTKGGNKGDYPHKHQWGFFRQQRKETKDPPICLRYQKVRMRGCMMGQGDSGQHSAGNSEGNSGSDSQDGDDSGDSGGEDMKRGGNDNNNRNNNSNNSGSNLNNSSNNDEAKTVGATDADTSTPGARPTEVFYQEKSAECPPGQPPQTNPSVVPGILSQNPKEAFRGRGSKSCHQLQIQSGSHGGNRHAAGGVLQRNTESGAEGGLAVGVDHPIIPHATLSLPEICDIIGLANNNHPLGNLKEAGNKFDICLSRALHNLTISSPDMNDHSTRAEVCDLCLIIAHILNHIAKCTNHNTASRCEHCIGMFNLMIWHAERCISTCRPQSRETSADLCYKICKARTWSVSAPQYDTERLRVKVKKYCAKVLGGPKEPEPEVTKESNLSPSVDIPFTSVTRTLAVKTFDPLPTKKLVRKPSQKKPITIPQPILEKQALDASIVPGTSGREQPKDDIGTFIYNTVQRRSDNPYETQRTYGQTSRTESLPLGQVHDTEQFMSEWSRPTGEPGVGEVVFAHPSQLRLVAGFWKKKREECERTRVCPYQHKEEGVILAAHKKKFNILRTRYQKHHQWERVSHLGNGMSGKCHLAIDLKSEFKFCCKKIHLLRFEEEELTLWSELKHQSVVSLYGAIRHGVKVYIFSEFFDGGSLAECINEQKLLGRRLSHWTAMKYLEQLLQVLAYLQSKNILHEDIKADNILLRRDTTYIALTDFGTSRRHCNPKVLRNKSPVGSPTHWSPEKASMEGHGFPSDLWAAICVLVHILSGEPPWVKRYMNKAAILNFIIYAKPAPMEDVPSNVQSVVRDLIEKGFTKKPELRSSASELLKHPAFRVLEEGNPEIYYSTLMSQAGVNGVFENNGSLQTSKSQMLYANSIPSRPYQESDKTFEQERGDVEDEVRVSSSPVTEDTNNVIDHTGENKCQQNKSEHNSKEDGKNIEVTERVEVSYSQTTSADQECSEQRVSQSGASQQRGALPPSNNPRVHELLYQDLEQLIPRLDDLFPSSDSSEATISICSFFTDTYPNDIKFRRSEELERYTPEERGNPIPNLSIFQSTATKGPELQAEEVTLLGEGVDAPDPLAEGDDPTSNNPVLVHLSLSSEECNSSEMFGPGPNIYTEDNQNSEDGVKNPTVVQFPFDDGMEHSAPVVSNLQQRKLLNLTLDVTCTGSKKPTKPPTNQSQFSSNQDITELSSPLKHDNSASGSNASASPYLNTSGSSSIYEEQEKDLDRLRAEYAKLHTGNKLVDVIDSASRNAHRETESSATMKPTTEDVYRACFPFTTDCLPGHKVMFYDSESNFLFDTRLLEWPVHWTQLYSVIKKRIKTQRYVHFVLCHMNGSTVDFDQELTEQESKIMIWSLKSCEAHCWCSYY